MSIETSPSTSNLNSVPLSKMPDYKWSKWSKYARIFLFALCLIFTVLGSVFQIVTFTESNLNKNSHPELHTWTIFSGITVGIIVLYFFIILIIARRFKHRLNLIIK